LTDFQIYLVTCVFCVPIFVILNRVHDGFVTLGDLTRDILWGLVPAWNLVLLVVMGFFVARKYHLLDWLLVRQNRLVDWWNEVSDKKVF
jgi:hypothetical protein